MATTQVTPTTEVRAYKKVFDLDSKETVQLVKVGQNTPVSSIEEGVNRLHNDAALILRLWNKALEDYAAEQLASDETVAWKQIEENEDGEEVISDVPETFQPILPEKAKQLSQTVVNMAKMLFGYKKDMVPGKDAESVKANRKAKAEAKEKALQMILSNPAAVEGLKG